MADEELCLIWRVSGHGGRGRDSVGFLLKLCNAQMSTGPHSHQKGLTRVCSRRESLSVEKERDLERVRGRERETYTYIPNMYIICK